MRWVLMILGILCLSGAPTHNISAITPTKIEVEEPKRVIYELPECVPVKITSASM